MAGLLEVKTPSSPQGMKGEVSLVFSEKDRDIGEIVYESLMRSGFRVTEQPDILATPDSQPIGTVLYLKSAGIPKAIAPIAKKVIPEGVRRQLNMWRWLFASAAIGLVALVGIGGSLYQKNLAADRNLGIAIEQRDRAIAASKQMNDKLYVANVTAERAIGQKDRALAASKQMNDKLYLANVTTERAIGQKDRALAERQQMNDKLYIANAKAERASAGEREAKAQAEQLTKELDKSNQRVELLEELLKRRLVQTPSVSP